MSRFALDGRVVVVTGGLGNLGASFCRALLDAGARVCALDVTDDPGRIERAGLAGHGPERLLCAAVDVTDRASLDRSLAAICERWGEVPHGLVNNAALDAPPDAPAADNGPFEGFSEASFDKVMAVNVKGVMLCCQVFGGAMAREGRGSIVNIGSIYGQLSPDQSLYQYRRDRGEVFFKPVAYSVSKSALLNLTRYLAVYWGGAGVRVNTLTFAGVFAGQEPGFLEPYTRKVPLGRMADPADYDGPVVFLLSDAARYMTGANMVVDGGFTAL